MRGLDAEEVAGGFGQAPDHVLERGILRLDRDGLVHEVFVEGDIDAGDLANGQEDIAKACIPEDEARRRPGVFRHVEPQRARQRLLLQLGEG